MGNLTTIFMSILGTLSIGSIIATIINNSYNRKTTITDIDKKKFYFYKYIFFSAVATPLNEKINDEKSKEFYQQLYQQIKYNENTSLLLSEEAIKLLKKIVNDKKYKITHKLNNRIKKDFRNLKYKFNYYTTNIKDRIIYIVVYIIFLISLSLLFASIIQLIVCIDIGEPLYFLSKENEIYQIMTILGLIGTLLTSVYLAENYYIFKN